METMCEELSALFKEFTKVQIVNRDGALVCMLNVLVKKTNALMEFFLINKVLR